MIKKQESNRQKTLISIFIVVIMVASSLGIILSGYAPQTNNLQYKDHEFVQEGSYLTTTVNGSKIKIQSYPSDIEVVKAPAGAMEILTTSKMIFVSYPMNGSDINSLSLAAGSAFDLSEFLDSRGVYTVLGVSDDNTGFEKLPVISCKNATSQTPVIEFALTNESSMALDGYCLRLNSYGGYDFVRYKDRIILGMAGLIN